MDMLVRDLLDPTVLLLRKATEAAPLHAEANDQTDLLNITPIGGVDSVARSGGTVLRRGNLVMVVEDRIGLSSQVGAICNYIGLNVEAVASVADLGVLLDERRPLALIASFESEHQDGGHVMKSVAMHDRGLPLMMVTGGNPIYMGAAEAMQEVFKLAAVTLPPEDVTFGQMVEFLARASQRNRRRRLGPTPDAETEESCN